MQTRGQDCIGVLASSSTGSKFVMITTDRPAGEEYIIYKSQVAR